MWKRKKTLKGNKKKVYIVLKILKKMYKTGLTSFDLKFSVDRALKKKKYASEKIGVSLQEVLKFYILDGKFTKIAEPLTKIGVTEISITDDGIKFKWNEKKSEE